MYDIINMTHYDRKSQHFTNSINQNTCMVRLPQCTNPCSFILVHAVVLADKLQKLYKLLLALGLHLVFVQTLAVVFQPVQQGVFLSSVARRCPMVALHKSIHLLVIDVPCFFICHVILFWGSSIILRIKFKICKDSHFYLYCQKNTARCALLLTFSLFLKTLVSPFIASLLSCGAHFVQARGIISHAMPINSSSHADTSSVMPCPSTSAMLSPNNNAARGINGPGCTVVTLLVKVQHLMFSSHGTRHTQCSTDGGKDGRSHVPQKPHQSSFVLVAHSCSSLKG